MKRALLPLGIFALLVVLLGVGLTRDPRNVPSAMVGQGVPAMQVSALNEPGVPLDDAALAGQVWVLNVWASWCAGCRIEHPLVAELAQRSQVPVVGLNYKDERQAAQGWLKRWGDPYHSVAFDPQGQAGIDWGVHATPTTYVIDRQGIIRHRHVGPISAEVLHNTLLPLIRRLNG